MRKAPVLFLLIVCFLSAAAQVKTRAQNAPASDPKQKRAEALVVRAVEKFGRTLDFRDIYREMFVSDRGVRKERIESILKGIVDEQTLRSLDPALPEEAFIKAHEVFALTFICALAQQKSFGVVEKEIFSGLNRRQQDFLRGLNSGVGHLIKSQTEFLELLAMGDAVIADLRGRITNEFRKKMQSKTRIETSRVLSQEHRGEILSKYGNSFEISVRIADQWLPLQFTVIEESGAMKILFAAVDVD